MGMLARCSTGAFVHWKEYFLFLILTYYVFSSNKGYMEPKDCWVALRMLGFNPSENDLDGFTKEVSLYLCASASFCTRRKLDPH